MNKLNIKINRLEMTCGACPSQWDAYTNSGDYIYIRYRFGSLTVSYNNKQIFQKNIGDSLDGCMSTSEMLMYTGIIYIGK